MQYYITLQCGTFQYCTLEANAKLHAVQFKRKVCRVVVVCFDEASRALHSLVSFGQ